MAAGSDRRGRSAGLRGPVAGRGRAGSAGVLGGRYPGAPTVRRGFSARPTARRTGLTTGARQVRLLRGGGSKRGGGGVRSGAQTGNGKHPRYLFPTTFDCGGV